MQCVLPHGRPRMKYAYHSDYKSIFTKTIEKEGRIHALIPKGKPWKNGFIERSNRTDKENLFNQIRFIDSDDRKYQLKLWEMDGAARAVQQFSPTSRN